MPKENLQHILVSKTLFKRLVNQGAVCSECGHTVDTHGGHMPCRGGYPIVTADSFPRPTQGLIAPQQVAWTLAGIFKFNRPDIDYSNMSSNEAAQASAVYTVWRLLRREVMETLAKFVPNFEPVRWFESTEEKPATTRPESE